MRVSAAPQPESRRILALGQRACGDLRGLLLDLPGALLDQAPVPNEWSLSETVRHMLWIERRYALQTRYALGRAASDPVRIPDDRLPTIDQVDVTRVLQGPASR